MSRRRVQTMTAIADQVGEGGTSTEEIIAFSTETLGEQFDDRPIDGIQP